MQCLLATHIRLELVPSFVFVAVLGIAPHILSAANHPEDEVAALYFGKTTPHTIPAPVERYTNLTADEFDELALAGRPFVIEDGGRGQPFVGWTCERFKKEYPNGVVKMEYVRSKNPFHKMVSSWEKKQHKIGNVDAGGPSYAPFYWGVKAADDPEEAATIFKGGRNPLPEVQKLMHVPPWMRPSKENLGEVLGSPEFWFSAPDAGASMHMDSHCESTYAIQLHGKRRWRVGWVPPVPNGTIYKNGAYADGAIYGKNYHPPLEAVVEEGQAFFMPSAFLHESNNIGEECAVSLTFQFRDPMPARYFRSSLRHLRRTGDFNECWKLLGSIAAFGQSGCTEQNPPNLEKADRDGDGQVSVSEVNTEILRAAHAFHDADQNGFVSKDELKVGWNDWVVAVREAKEKKNRKILPSCYKYLHQDEL